MKKLILTSALAFTIFVGFSQMIDTRKKIEVTGAAEQEITPDEIFIGISLQEYMTTTKKKVSIEDLEKQLQSAVIKSGIANTDFMINNISSYQNYWEKKKNPMFLASKQYILKVKDLSKLNTIISAVDPKGVASTQVSSYSHSKLETYKTDLKVKALQNAKEKANLLLNGIGEKLGGALDIREIYNENVSQPMYRGNMMMMKSSDMGDAEAVMPDIDFKKIKLSYQVIAVFEIK